MSSSPARANQYTSPAVNPRFLRDVFTGDVLLCLDPPVFTYREIDDVVYDVDGRFLTTTTSTATATSTVDIDTPAENGKDHSQPNDLLHLLLAHHAGSTLSRDAVYHRLEEDSVGSPAARTVIDVVEAFRLVELSHMTRGQYMDHATRYLARLRANLLLDLGNSERASQFGIRASDHIKRVLGAFDDYKVYRGPTESDSGMLILCRFSPEDGITPTFTFFKDGLRELQ